MSARKKRKCEECGIKANMAYDPEGKLCAECLRDMKNEMLSRHRNGEITYQNAEEVLMKRLRMSRLSVEEILFPPLGTNDFPSEMGGIKMSRMIMERLE